MLKTDRELSLADSSFSLWGWVLNNRCQGLVLFFPENCRIMEFMFNLYVFLFSCGRFSVSNDLKYDAERDLRDIGAKNILVHSLNKV